MLQVRPPIQSIDDLRRLAQRRLPRAIFDFIDGGAEDEFSLRANRTQFERFGLVNRCGMDVSSRTTDVEIFGRRYAAPLIVGPTGMAGLARPRADVLLARAAARLGIPFTLSTVSSASVEVVAAEAGGSKWFQLYPLKNRELTFKLVERAKAADYEVLVITLDCPVAGQRERDPRNGFTVPLRPRIGNIIDLLSHTGWLLSQAGNAPPRPENLVGAAEGLSDGQVIAAYMQKQLDPAVTWARVAEIRDQWAGPVVLKGILSVDDAKMAVRLGADGIVVSNHGGRQLDHAVAPLDVLESIVVAVAGRSTIFCDSGFRRGSDVFKALALGARAVFLGRAPLWGVAAGGEDGAALALMILRDELDRAMALTGCRAVGDIAPALLCKAPAGA